MNVAQLREEIELEKQRMACEEQNAALKFVKMFSKTNEARNIEQEAWSAFCHTLMLSSEFVYVE